MIYYIFSYDNSKKEEILNTYTPIKKQTFTPQEVNFNQYGGGDKLPNGVKLMQRRLQHLWARDAIWL